MDDDARALDLGMTAVELMKTTEAKEIVRMCKEELYPPINPAVLCRAILTIYLREGWNDDCRTVLDWFYRTGIKGVGKEK